MDHSGGIDAIHHEVVQLPEVASDDAEDSAGPMRWAFNTSDWPYSAAGAYSPRQADYPRYMDSFGEIPRGLHATRLLTGIDKRSGRAPQRRQPAQGVLLA